MLWSYGDNRLTVTWFDSKQSYGEHGYGSTVMGSTVNEILQVDWYF